MADSTEHFVVFSYCSDSLAAQINELLGGELGSYEARSFPDGESYIRISSEVLGKQCIVVANLSMPNEKLLPLLFLLDTIRDLGAARVGLVAPYLSYMRQDKVFIKGEALTSKVFAHLISTYTDFLLTVDPHLHRYHALSEIYNIPTKVIHGAPALAEWLKKQGEIFLIGPDAESRQWVESISQISGHPFVIGEKERLGDKKVQISLPDLSHLHGLDAVIIDDVISSGHTILKCVNELNSNGFVNVSCAAIHGLFANNSDKELNRAGVTQLVTCNTIEHSSNGIDISPLISKALVEFLNESSGVSI